MKLIKSLSNNCKNCYKCLRQCSVKAISYTNDKARVIEDACILCGHCALICPQNAQVMINDYDTLKGLLNSGKKVIASVAPSFIADFDVNSFEKFRKMLIKAGFFDAFETIIGARLVNQEYEKIMANSDELLLSSACPVAINYIHKYYPSLNKYLANVLSPMVAHAKIIKNDFKDSLVVFIGPCLAKKDEVKWEDKIVDLAITFEELDLLFKDLNIYEKHFDETIINNESDNIRLYPQSNGVVNSLNNKNKDFTYLSIDGLENLKQFFEEIEKKELKNTFIEISACKGSCLNGPCRINKNQVQTSKIKLNKYVSNNTYIDNKLYSIDLQRTFNIMPYKKIIPSEYELREILKQIGKTTSKDELNCGACGFNTCREKALAVYNQNAELSMCLPYMKQRAETVSWEIINNSPNGIVAFDSDLVLQKLNPKAYAYFDIPYNLKTEEINCKEYIDLFDYELMIAGACEPTIKKKIYIERTNKTLDVAIVYVKELNFIFGFYMDVTEEEEKEKFLTGVRYNTINVANELIDKQMRSVQEIASLLGETVAETKIALTNLKKAMEDQDE